MKRFRKCSEPRVAGTSKYWFFMGAMMSAPTLMAWLPRSQETVSRNSNWSVCWNLGRKSGEPILPRPGPWKYPSMVIPGIPPATVGSVIDPGIVAEGGGCWPNGSCTASDFDCVQEKRSSLTMVGEKMRVQPATTLLVLIFWLPKAEVLVPSMTPVNSPGMSRCRLE